MISFSSVRDKIVHQPNNVPTLPMAMATGVAVASIYYNQPMLGLISRDFTGSGVEGLIPTVTQFGYSLGLIFLVPLGDIVDRRSIIVTQLTLLSIALFLLSTSSTITFLLAFSAIVGMCSTATQQIVPFAANLAPYNKCGAVVGTIMAGLFCGILLSRTVAGLVSTYWGWRAMFLFAVPFVIIMAITMYFCLPHGRSEPNIRYGQLMRSLFHLWGEFSELRWAAITQALLFGAFSAFWATLSLMLELPQYNLGPSAAGMFGLVGLIGIFAAPVAGRFADNRGPHIVVIFGACVTLVAWGLLGWLTSIIGIVVGVVFLDLGVHSALVSNQHIIYSLRPEARSRLNTVFMSCKFLGGSLGSAAAAVAWHLDGWAGVSMLGVGLSALAVMSQILALKEREQRLIE